MGELKIEILIKYRIVIEISTSDIILNPRSNELQ